jgi:hypothetical protein
MRVGRLLAFLAAASVACGVQEVVVSEDDATDSGVGGPCFDGTDCSTVAFCAKSACDAVKGQCEARPLICDDRQAPVCGCDGVNYWNDCLRRSSGVIASTPGECTTQVATCGGFRGRPCPAQGAFCAKPSQGGGDCMHPEPGVCWVLPPSCPVEDAGAAIWASCGPPFPACLDTCSAIRTERPFHMPFHFGCP